jgi:general L-amino acid transport system permease protein
MKQRLPTEIEVALEDERAVEVAPHREPKTAGEWVRDNLFSTWFNTILTVISAAVAVWVGFSLLRWIFVTADWGVIQANLRVYMTGRFPVDKLWSLWVCIYLISTLVGLSWGTSGRRLSWAPAKTALRIAFALGALGMLVYLLETLTIWLLMGVAAALYAGGVVAGRLWPRPLRIPLMASWVLTFPAVIIIIRVVADVPPQRWGGFMINVMVAFVGIFASFPLGLLLALGRRSSLQAISKFSVLFIEVIRGVPLFTLLIFGQFVLPLLLPRDLDLSFIVRAMLMFTIFSSAYVAEIVRGGLQGVHPGQYEAARALGLPMWRMMAFVALPQALRNTIPAMIGHFISLFKDTSLLVLIGVTDMLAVARRAARAGGGFSGDIAQALLAAAFIFFLVAFSMSRWSQRLEKRVGVGER